MIEELVEENTIGKDESICIMKHTQINVREHILKEANRKLETVKDL